MIEYKIPLWTIISFAIVQLVSFAWFLIKLHFTTKEHRARITEMEAENKALRVEFKEFLKQIQQMTTDMAVVKNNVEHITVALVNKGQRRPQIDDHG